MFERYIPKRAARPTLEDVLISCATSSAGKQNRLEFRISVPESICTQVGMARKGRAFVALGTGSDAGLLRIEVADEGNVALIGASSSKRLYLRLPATWVKLTAAHASSPAPCVVDHAARALVLRLPSWVVEGNGNGAKAAPPKPAEPLSDHERKLADVARVNPLRRALGCEVRRG